MAILRSNRLERAQRERAEFKIVRKSAPLFQIDAHVQTYRDHLIANATVKVKHCETGREIKARWPGDRDYRSFAPKGIVLLSDRVKGLHKRFEVN